MATYSWVKDGGGNWSDSGSWHLPQDSDQSIPGAGDDVYLYVEGTVNADGHSVGSVLLGYNDTIVTGGLSADTISGPGTLQSGDYSVTTMSGTVFASGTLTAGTVKMAAKITGGTVNATTLDGAQVSGGDVTADTVKNSTLSGGTVHAGTLSDSRVTGATVTAEQFSGNFSVSDGSLDAPAIVLADDEAMITTGGTVTAGSLKMTDGSSGLLELAVFAGKVTISGAASFTGSRGVLQVGHNNSGSSDFYTGGRLHLEGGFKLTALDGLSGNSLQTLAGAKTTIDGAVLVDMTNGPIGNSGLIDDGGTLNLTGTASLGKTAAGNLQVFNGGTAAVNKVEAGVQAGSNAFIVVSSELSHLSATGAVTLGVKGDGFLRLTDGSASLRTLVLGADTGGTGGVSVQGGTLEVTKSVVVGGKGTGSVTAILGGHFLVGDVVVAGTGSPTGGPKDQTTGFHTRFGGHLTVSAGAEMITDALTLGDAGYAQASVADGDLTVDGATILAKRKGSEAQISLTDGGVWHSKGGMTVGAAGKALIAVDGGTLKVNKDLTLGANKGSSGEVDLAPGTKSEHGSLVLGGDLTIGGGGTGIFDLDHSALTMKHSAIVLGETAGSKGTLELHSVSILNGDSLAVGGTEHRAGGKGSLAVASGSTASFDTVTVWKTGNATLIGGALHVTGDLNGNGEITIGKAGTLILDGVDKSVGVSFAASSKGAELDLTVSSQFQGLIKGFAQGDVIAIEGLDKKAALSVETKGANTIVTIHDHGDTDTLTFAGHYAKSDLQLSASGLLTTADETRLVATVGTASGTAYAGSFHGPDTEHSLFQHEAVSSLHSNQGAHDWTAF